MRALARGLNAGTRLGPVARRFTRAHAQLYVATRGRFPRRWFGSPVLVIETTGRRSGRPRRTPLVYARDGERFLVMPANAGNHRTPAWWLNLRAAGGATVIWGGRRLAVRARVPEPSEGARLRELLLAAVPAVPEYERFTHRSLPIVILEPQ